MDSLSLIDLNPDSTDQTDRLYYDQFQYCLKLKMKDFSCLREMRLPADTVIDVQDGVVKRFQQRLRYSPTFNRQLSLPTMDPDARHWDLENLLEMLEFLWPTRHQIKLIFSGDWGYVYSNNITLLRNIALRTGADACYVKQAVIVRSKNTIALKSSSYSFRSFLKERLCSDTERTSMVTYLQNQSGIKIGRGLQDWIKYRTRRNHHWTRRYHYFDHNDPKIELMLQLVCPGIVRITMPIIEVNN